MKLDFSRQAFVEALIHLLVMAAAGSISRDSLPEILTDAPKRDVQTLV